MAWVCALALAACAAESEGDGQNNIGMGAQGGAGGGVNGVSGGAGGSAGAAGVAGMMNVGGVGGMMTSGGASGGAGMMATGGVGGMMTTGGAGGAMATGGAGGMMATGGAGGAGGDMPMEWEDKGMGDGSDVITIGDSYMNYGSNGGIEISLEEISGRDYRNYAVAGTMVLDDRIPNQFRAAVAENPNVKTVIMTGGGNDILLGNVLCTVAWSESCNQTVRDVAAALAEMRMEMADAGVEDVVIVGYGYPTNEVVKPGLDLARELTTEMCKATDTPRCHSIDPVEEIAGKLIFDGIHPTPEGYDILGQMTWDLLQERKLRR
jgi:lysophospholipase L1-like esterase